MKKFALMGAALALGLALWAGGARAAEEVSAFPDLKPAQALAAQVQQDYARIKTLRAEFIRRSDYVAMGNEGERQVEGSGTLLWASPLRLRLEQFNPSPEMVVADGVNVWWVRPERSRADVYPIDSFTGNLLSLLEVLGGLAGIDEKFFLEEPQPSELSQLAGELTLVLRPRENRPDLHRLILWLDGKSRELRGFKFSNVVGDSTMYRFSRLELNPSFAASAFSYTPPDDYRVNDQRP
jgi:outer membrane lipoprotein carrier protein